MMTLKHVFCSVQLSDHWVNQAESSRLTVGIIHSIGKITGKATK